MAKKIQETFIAKEENGMKMMQEKQYSLKDGIAWEPKTKKESVQNCEQCLSRLHLLGDYDI